MGLRDTLRPIAHAISSVIGTHGLDHRLAAIEAAIRLSTAGERADAGTVAACRRPAVPGRQRHAAPITWGPDPPACRAQAGIDEVTWQIRASTTAGSAVAVRDVMAESSERVLASREVLPGAATVSLTFSAPKTTFGLQFRCSATGGQGFSILRQVKLVGPKPLVSV